MSFLFARRHQGVTLLEIVVVIGIITLIGAIVYSPLNDFRAQKTLDAAVEKTLAAFSQAHLDTISSKNNFQYGVHIASGEVVYYIGPTYATGTATNLVFTLPPAVEIFNIDLVGGGSDVLYHRLTGSTDESGTFQVRPKGRTTTVTTITVNKTGATSI
jgi:prepilin-type N-terminal cleavage/methylation domain-containing protein